MRHLCSADYDPGWCAGQGRPCAARQPDRADRGLCGAGTVLGGSAAWVLIPAVTTTQAISNKVACSNNLKQIAIALHAYHDDYDCFPPAYVTDDKGQPMHSWRVLILPYLGEKQLYGQYNFDEPWDSTYNQSLTGQMPAVYFCPENPDKAARRAGETNYMVIVGNESMFPGEKSTKIADITDGTSNTIMVVETAAPGINWMKPHDLSIDDMSMEINGGPEEPGSYHPEGGIHVALADGSVHFLSDKTRKRELYNSVTKAGAEPAHLNAIK